jgi:hypothetical protein
MQYACALGHIADITMLIYSMNPQLAPAYLEGNDYNAIVERIKKEKKEFDASIARDEERN